MWKHLFITLIYNIILFSFYKLFGFEVAIIFALTFICSNLVNPTIFTKNKKITQRTSKPLYTTNKKGNRF